MSQQVASAAKKVLIGGGSGFIGKALTKHLVRNGYHVTLISRKNRPNSISWDKVRTNGISDFDAVIQLSGANVFNWPWTAARKKELIDSRVHTTEALVAAIQKSAKPPSVFISGSAIGIYPVSTGEEFTEESTNYANNFAGNMVRDWEKASQPLEKTSTRRVITRFGVVLGDGGMLGNMWSLFGFGLGGRLGSGEQYMPWIHLKDVARLHQYVIEHPEVKGVLNAVAPEQITNLQLTQTLGKELGMPTKFSVPEIVVKTIFGERAFLVLEGQKVVPKRTLETGFQFAFPTLEAALKDVVKPTEY